MPWLRYCHRRQGWLELLLPAASGWEHVSLRDTGSQVAFHITCEVSEPTAVPTAHLSLPPLFAGCFLAPLLSVLSPSSPCRAFQKADGRECHTGHLSAHVVPRPS